MFDRTRTAAAAIAAATALSVTSGCANSTAAGAPTAVDLASAQATYNSVIDDVYGTKKQRLAGAERGWLLTQMALAECMKNAGAQYPVAPYPAAIESIGQPAPGDLMAFSPLRDDFGVGKSKQAKAAGGEPKNPVFDRLEPGQQQAYFDRLEGCQAAAQGFENAHAPTGRNDLIDKLLTTLAKVQDSASVAPLLENYADCVAEYGVQAKSMTELYQTIPQAYPKPTRANADITKDPGWAAAVAYEAKAAKADKACRADAVDAGMVAAVPALNKFSAANKQELAANRNAYAALEREVTTLRTTAKQY